MFARNEAFATAGLKKDEVSGPEDVHSGPGEAESRRCSDQAFQQELVPPA